MLIFEQELKDLLNRHSMENGSDTPDFLLAAYLKGCLEIWNKTMRDREKWYGRSESLTNVLSLGDTL